MPTPYPKSENTKQKPKPKQKTRPILYTKGKSIRNNRYKQKRNRKETEIPWMN
jgi:hypothetical protein